MVKLTASPPSDGYAAFYLIDVTNNVVEKIVTAYFHDPGSSGTWESIPQTMEINCLVDGGLTGKTYEWHIVTSVVMDLYARLNTGGAPGTITDHGAALSTGKGSYTYGHKLCASHTV